jgi:hypothetical protein
MIFSITVAVVTDSVIIIHNGHRHNRTIAKKATISLYISECPIEIMNNIIELQCQMKTYPYFGTSAAKPVVQVRLLL